MSRRQIANSRLLITGASQGIGRALAESAARRGGKVVAAARSLDLLRELAEQMKTQGHALEIVQADVTDPAGRQAMIDACRDRFGGLDILINNAGIGATGHFATADPERLRSIFEVNVFGLCETTRLAIPVLKQGNRPAICNISSMVGKRGIPGRSEYSASKFAVQGFSEALRAELAPFGIDVVVINPGLTQTNFPKNMLERKSLLQVDHLRGMTSEQCADKTLAHIERGTHEVTFTANGKLMVWANRIAPRLCDWIAASRVKRINAKEPSA